ncbi:DUF2075 domain-containing protein [Prolixibacteraceae bacterium JC049]|nr:DUF2075 domain-containing protein [Prolixibacteraceae bacterium JC049]
MIKNHLQELIVDKLGFSPSEDQKEVIRLLSEFTFSDDPDSIFLLRGYAGTGKTSVLSSFVKTMDELKRRCVLLAPTGRAAKVLSRYSGKQAYTIHKKIYRQQSSTDGTGRFTLDKNLYKNTWFIVDEASMIANASMAQSVFGSGRLLDDLIEYVYTGENCRLILTGDTAQLPPVGLPISPALDAQELDSYGRNVLEYEMTQVIRQAQESGILYNATQLREMVSEDGFFPGYFPLETQFFDDIQRLAGGDLIEEISTCYDRFGMDETMIVTRSNKRANKFNEGIRNTILYKDGEITPGDHLMVVKNNYFWLEGNDQVDFIANGDIAEIIRIGKYEEMYGHRFANVTVRLMDYKDLEIDCKIMLDTLMLETPALSADEQMKFFHEVSADYADIRNKKQRWERIRSNEYFNALQVKFAYAVTCHKAQGGQWKAVFVDQGYLLEEMIDIEFLRWLYTAFTRPTQKLYLVNFNKEFFEGEEDPDY